MAGRASSPPPERAVNLEQLLAAKEIVLVCGSGGVGKTTTAAALGAMAAVHLGGKVLVLTVDPARRLAAALGLESFGNVETRISASAFTDAGADPKGEMWVAMLDTKQSWDDLVRQHAPSPEVRDAILANPLYGNITGKFVQSHDYIAMERLYEIHASGRYDLVIVDTPPTRHALDFLDAPQRMADFFSGRLLRWLTVGYRSRLVTVASRPFYLVADRILGTKFLEDIAEFFGLFQTMEKGFIERARLVSQVLADRRTTFCVVSTLEAAPAHEAEFFVRELGARKLHLGALILNKVLPPGLREPEAAAAAAVLRREAAALATELAPLLDVDPAQLGRVLAEVARSFDDYRLAATREAEQRAELAASPDITVAVPYVEADIHDVAGLLRLATQMG
ncbi:MAG TPA: ArsA-related P-loop ATPase [Acidimicrobiales bacterium]